MTNATRGSKATKKRAPKSDESSLVVETKLVSLTQAEKLSALVREALRGEAKLAGQKRAYAPIALADTTPEPGTAVVDRGPRAWLKLDALRPEGAWHAGRAVHATLKREQVDALLAHKG